MYMCMCIYIYIYTHTYTFIYPQRDPTPRSQMQNIYQSETAVNKIGSVYLVCVHICYNQFACYMLPV